MEIDIESWYEKYGPMVFRRCKAMLGGEDEAMDAMQEVFIKLMRKQNELNDLAPSSLLYTMASNHCLNVIKSRKRQAMSVDDDFFSNFPAVERGVESVDAKSLLEQIFKVHDEKTRLIAWLHFVDGHTLEATAKQVGMSLSGIRKRLRNLSGSSLSLKEELAR